MTHKNDTGQGHHNPSDPQSNTSVDYKLATGKNESFPPEAMKNGDITDIMDELATMKRPPNPLGSSIPESTLHRISKKVIKEAVEDKKAFLFFHNVGTKGVVGFHSSFSEFHSTIVVFMYNNRFGFP